MNFIAVVVIGAVLGALDGVGIFFEPKEPYKWQILFAATLKGMLVALLTGFSLGCKGRSEIGRRTICDSERDHHRGANRPLHSHLCGQEDLTNRWSQPLAAVTPTFDFMKQLSISATPALVYPPGRPAVAQLRLVRPTGEMS